MRKLPIHNLIHVTTLCLLVFVLGGCWPSQAPNAQQQVATVGTIIRNYNASHPRDLTQMRITCHQAARELENSDAWHSISSTTYKSSSGAYSLRNALMDAHAAFSDCAAGTSKLNFGLTVQAIREIESANWWIRRLGVQES